MRITLFTRNRPRHIALIETLAGIGELYAVVETAATTVPGTQANTRADETLQRYSARVSEAEAKLFGGPRFLPSNVHVHVVEGGGLRSLDRHALAPALESDVYVVFGSSFITGELADYLVSRRAINLHMGVSPYYRGSACNFWALHDDRPDLVGGTIHLLSHGLDSGPILFHALPAPRPYDPFELGMWAVKASHMGLAEAIRSGSLQQMEPVAQDRAREIRYSRIADFNPDVAGQYLSRLPDPGEIRQALASADDAAYVRPCRF